MPLESCAITPASTTANYTFNWSNGSTEADISNLPAGSYQVTISNTNGCSYQTEINLNQPDPLEVLVSQIDIECYNDGNGEILVESTIGGTQPYQYSLNGDTLSDIVVYSDLMKWDQKCEEARLRFLVSFDMIFTRICEMQPCVVDFSQTRFRLHFYSCL